MNTSQLAKIIQGAVYGQDVEFTQISIDTRSLQPGDVYIAIVGEFKDGHDFIPQALAAGASCIVCEKSPQATVAPYIIVKNTITALQDIATYHRSQMSLRVAAVTGSCGKTTTRSLLESIFAQAGHTHASPGSFNNHLGVPLTLLALKPEHQFFVAEIGANHMGEIATLVPLVKPDVAVITNVAPAHLEGFGSLANIAQAKAEIYGGLSADGTAVINMDDEFAQFWLHLNKQHKVISFGIKHDADVMADDIHVDATGYASFTLILPESVCDVTLPLIGEHNVYNALAAAACSYALGLTAEQIQRGLEQAMPVKRRLIELKTAEGAVVIDDSYNANPLSTEAALKLLVHRSQEPIFVFADMKEMGPQAHEIHMRLGHTAKALGVMRLYCYGVLAKETADAFGSGAFHFDDKNALIEELKKQLSPTQTILVKGSNSMKMNEVVEAIVDARPVSST